MNSKKFDYKLKDKIKEYTQNNRKPILFDFKKASQCLLNGNFDNDNRQIQYVHYYPGRLSPYIPLYILSLEDLSNLDGYVLDPFAGSGTILLESLLNPVKRNAVGVEINPLGRLISKVKTTPLNLDKINQLTERLHGIYLHSKNNGSKPIYKNIDLWFSKKTIRRLAKLRESIKNLDAESDYKDFLWLCFSSIIRKVSKADPYVPPPVVLRLKKYKRSTTKYKKLKNFLKNSEKSNIWALFEKAVKEKKTKLEVLNSSQEIKNRVVRAEVIWDNALSTRRGRLSECGRIDKTYSRILPSGSIDIIFTSPPYITAQKYIRTGKLELFWLGYTEEEIANLEKVSTGTERISKTYEKTTLGVSSIDSLINNVFLKHEIRGLMVNKYFDDMLKALIEMYRVLKDDGYVILVVGNNKVLKKRVDTYRLLTDAAVSVGFKEMVIFKDRIRTRSMMTKRNVTGGLIRDEYIIILKKGT